MWRSSKLKVFGAGLLGLAACGGSREPSDGGSGGAGGVGNGGAGGEVTQKAPTLLALSCRGSEQKSTEPTSLAAPESVTLRAEGRLVGAAVAAGRLSDANYAGLLAAQFSSATPENEMKWDATEPFGGTFTFTGADAIVAFAKAHDMVVRGHTLVWYSQLPAWVNGLSGADAVREAMTRHIQGVMGHYRDAYPGVVTSWDVVNEAVDTPMGVPALRDNVFLREIGESYIAEAFQVARATVPEAKLYYNDFGIEGTGAKANFTYELIKKLVEAGVPIDGVGFQMHTAADDRGPTRDEFRTNLQRYVALGLKVNISEMDVNLCRNSNGNFALEQQRFRYNRVIATCLEFEACESVALWGVVDKYSWLNGFDTCSGAPYAPKPLAFDDMYQRKPAFWGIYDALNGCYYD